MVGRDGRPCGVMGFWGKTVFFRSFPLISAHFRSFWLWWALVLVGKKTVFFRSFPLTPAHSCSFQSWWALVVVKKNLLFRSFPLKWIDPYV